MADLATVGSNGFDVQGVFPTDRGLGGLQEWRPFKEAAARAMTTHRRTFGTTPCAIHVRFQPGIDDPWFVAQAVVIVDHPRELRWVGGRSGPLEVRDVTEHDAMARMMEVLDQRFGPPGERVPDGAWTSSSPILPPNDATSGVPVRLVWTDGRPDTLTSMPKRETQVELSVGGVGGEDRVATFALTGERDTTFRWVYKQLDRPA